MSAIQWYRELSLAVARAKSEQRPLLIDFYSDTCLGCQKMETDTYPGAEVVEAVEREFVPVKFNVKQPRVEFHDLLRMTKPLFSPLFLFLDPSGTELRRTTGYLPPEEFRAELQLVLGLADLLHARFGEGYARLRGITERFPRSHAAPEALYWSGVAAYRWNGRGLDGLLPQWLELQARYPESTWAVRSSCVSVKVPAKAG